MLDFPLMLWVKLPKILQVWRTRLQVTKNLVTDLITTRPWTAMATFIELSMHLLSNELELRIPTIYHTTSSVQNLHVSHYKYTLNLIAGS